jgi:serine/threonine-protein kinase
VSLTVGSRFGSFEVLGSLGAGGMGTVYRARDTKLGREVALKVLPTSFASDPDRLMRFEREPRTLAALNHPHIAQLLHLEQHEQTSALVMELVDGEDLSARIARGLASPKPAGEGGAIPLDEALPLARQIAEALEAAHEQGIIHRDLKPANIKVRDDGTVKVLDFGLAKALDSGAGSRESGAGKPLADSPTITSPAMTRAGIILGTGAYMAPEQARGKAVDKRADIWAFGCVLFEMLSGRRAFAGDDITDVLSRVLQREPDWTLLPKDLPTHVTTLLSRCLEKDPKRRVRDIGDARLLLDGAFAPSSGAQSPSAASRPRAGLGLWLGLAGALAAGIVLTAAAAAALWPRAQPAPVVRFPTDLRVNVGDLYNGAITLSPDASRVVIPVTTGFRIRDFDALASRMLYTMAAPKPGAESVIADFPSWPTFSPDGQSVAFVEGGQLKRIGLDGGSPVVIAPVPSLPFGVSWTMPDTIVFAHAGGIMRVAASGGTPELVVKGRDGELIAMPQLLPDGRTLLFSVAKGRWAGGQVVAQRIGKDDRTVLASPGYAARYVPSGPSSTNPRVVGHLLYQSGPRLMAARFDPASLTPAGEPRPVLDGLNDLILTGAASYDVSASGALAYLPPTVMPPTRMVWVDRTGREEPIPAPERSFDSPRVSPDGDRVALNFGFTGAGGAWVYSRSRNILEQIDDAVAAGSLRWSPNGEEVVYYGEDLTAGPGLFRRRADGAATAERLATGTYVPASWSADGRQIIYVDFGIGRPGSRAPDLGVVTLEGGRATTRTLWKTPVWEDDAALSPDGRWLVYESNEAGGLMTDVFVRPYPDVERGKWRISDAGGYDPVWSRDGRTLFYRSGRAVKSVTASGANPAAWGRPVTLFEGDYVRYEGLGPPEWDVAPDGRFLMLKRTGALQPPPQVIVVLNWIEELKRLMPQ